MSCVSSMARTDWDLCAYGAPCFLLVSSWLNRALASCARWRHTRPRDGDEAGQLLDAPPDFIRVVVRKDSLADRGGGGGDRRESVAAGGAFQLIGEVLHELELAGVERASDGRRAHWEALHVGANDLHHFIVIGVLADENARDDAALA